MTAIGNSGFEITQTGRLARLNARFWVMALIAAVLAGAGMLSMAPMTQLGLWVMAAAVAGVALAVRGVSGVRAWRGRQADHAVMRFIEHDAAACFATGPDGVVRYQNAAAMARLGPQRGTGATQAMTGLLANPDALVMRLFAEAASKGAAREDVVHRHGTLRVSVHKTSDSFLWRFEDIPAPEQGAGGAAFAIPMAVINGAGAVVHVNQALRDLLGLRPKRLSEILEPSLLRNGAVVPLQGAEARFVAQLFVHDTGDKGKEVFFLPADGETSQPGAALDPMFNAVPVPLLLLNPNGQVLRANRMAQTILPNLDLGTSRFSQMFEGLGRSILDWISDAAKGRGLSRAEVVRVTGVIPEQYLQVTLGRVLIEGETSILAVLNDATELKSLEAQFVQSQKMQAIGQLAGGVAHDFNNLLTAISGHCDLLLLRHDKGDADYADLMQINQNSNRAAALVGQLLAFSRKQTLQPERLDLRESLSELTHLLNRLVGEKTQLKLSNDPGLLPIRADRRQLEQVLMNLVVNARDAMPGGGVIRVETQCQYLPEDLPRNRVVVPAGQYVVVRVIDTGCGIPPDYIDRIFEPFVTTKRPGEGTGLGLSMAYGIVKQTGGFIFADSVLNKGTEFSLYFPVDDSVDPVEANADLANAVAPIDPPAEGAQGQSVHGRRPKGQGAQQPGGGTTDTQGAGAKSQEGGVILLVEDEAPVRAFASRALRMRGYTVMEAASGEDALELLEDDDVTVDLFVTDVMMPGMDGPSWVKEAHKKRPDVHTVFVSGYAQTTFAEDREATPNSVFLPKPFSLAELTQTVQQHLS